MNGYDQERERRIAEQAESYARGRRRYGVQQDLLGMAGLGILVAAFTTMVVVHWFVGVVVLVGGFGYLVHWYYSHI